MGQPREPLFFKIGEAAARVGVTGHVLRFWTKEFPQIQPQRLRGRHRLYSSEDIRLFLEIKRLLYEERFTIEGARKHLERGVGLFDNLPSVEPARLDWAEIRRELMTIRHLLLNSGWDGAGGDQ
ncbi:MAG: MerR family transcriptional regulator [Deltaproteobacteria bacterium]|jgi:DNA-binding transcriptional MerR regulator|nr:MerR family transcriptional regulator [Deltaproteobacteria bacterium]